MKSVRWHVVTVLLVLGTVFQAGLAQQSPPDELRIGVFTFLSGPAAAYGMPGRNAADLLFDEINRQGGIGGVPIRPIFVDEAQGTDGVVSEFRRLASDEGVHVMIAALSSANCLALAPVAEQLRMPTLMWNCDTHQLFLEDRYRYVHRTNSSTIPEFLAYAVYLLHKKPDVRRVAIINPDYAFGHDAALIFRETLRRFNPDIEVVAELYPRLGSSSFHTEISRLVAARPDVVFSNLWGADLENFVQQAMPRGLFQQSTVVLALGTTVFQRFGANFPEGVIVGVLGDAWHLTPTAQANLETQRFVELYRERFGEDPVFPSFKMANTILALNAAYERALEQTEGPWPTREDLVEALQGLEVENFTGTLRMREDHDGLVDQVVGVSRHVPDHPYPIMADMVRYPAELVTPPVGVDPIEWIRSLPSDFLDQLPEPGSYGR